MIQKFLEEKTKITNAQDTFDFPYRFLEKRRLRYTTLFRSKKAQLRKLSLIRLFVFSSIPILYTTLYFLQSSLASYLVLFVPFIFFLYLVSLYSKKKSFLSQIFLTLRLIEKEINRMNGNVKELHGIEPWEYDTDIRNHPLSIDLDLCTKQGLITYLDTTVSKEGWRTFIENLLQMSVLNPNTERNRIQSILKTKTLTYQYLRKGLFERNEKETKVSIYEGETSFNFWDRKKILKKVYKLLGVLTPVWLVGYLIFSLPFLPLLLLINLSLFLSYRSSSFRIWNQIRFYKETISRFQFVWIRLSPHKREQIRKFAKHMENLGNSSEWIISPIPHFVLNVICLWDLWKVQSFEKWLKENSELYKSLRLDWIQIEACLPICEYWFLNPETEFPSWNQSREFFAESIAHPLIPKNSRIANRLPALKPGSLMILTGSNMSGKTTYLRSIAINLLISRVGGSICGKNISISDFRIHTLIRSQDSLEDGISFFYSEVRRLADIIRNTDVGDKTPILFLDEILKGTNSNERHIATREILFALREKGAIVFLTTHDLELANMEGASLFHFTELEKDGEMTFDYQLRNGISKSTNALKILKKEGIPIRDL